MLGRIKRFNSEKGYGFIIGEDGNDYFVHISNVVSMQDIHTGMYVNFEATENGKGKCAIKVTIVENKKPTFISFGDVRIKTSNIKNYGIAYGDRYYVKVYEDLAKYSDNLFVNLFGSNWVVCCTTEISEKTYLEIKKSGYAGSVYIQRRNGEIQRGGHRYISESDFSVKTIPYLYITTYQNDNYKFWDDKVSFDIRIKCKEIDDCML